MWPITECVDWMGTNGSNECLLPQEGIWTIHGAWPSHGGGLGPEYCANGGSLDMNELQSLMERMKQFWPNIHTGKFYQAAHLYCSDWFHNLLFQI